MKVLLFTSNAYRHKHVANCIALAGHDLSVITEVKDAEYFPVGDSHLISEHFKARFETEKRFFEKDAFLHSRSFPMRYGEANSTYIANLCKSLKPDIIFCFGGSLLKEEILSIKNITSTGYFINLHLGLSPYYRGSGTNFWPFVNDELEYVGSTIHHIDLGIDTGNIISHVIPDFEDGDTVHSVGCKVIERSAQKIVELLHRVEQGSILEGVPQWKPALERVYKMKDFNEEALQRYYANLKGGMIERFLLKGREHPTLVGC